MASGSALFFQKSGAESPAIDVIRQHVEIVGTDFNDRWQAYEVDVIENIDDDILAGFSVQTVIALGYENSTGFLHYRHFENGKRSRILIFSSDGEGIWESVTGLPEAWESEAFATAPVPGSAGEGMLAKVVAVTIAEFHGLPDGSEAANYKSLRKIDFSGQDTGRPWWKFW